MNELNKLTRSERIQAVLNTLQVLEMPATFDNCNKMTGIYSQLMQIRDELHKEEEAAANDGDAEAE